MYHTAGATCELVTSAPEACDSRTWLIAKHRGWREMPGKGISPKTLNLRVCAPPAPEVISNSRSYDGKLADVWSAGVMLYVILFCGDASSLT